MRKGRRFDAGLALSLATGSGLDLKQI